MNKLTQPVPEDEDEFGAELSEADLEAWFERNREPLREALQLARDQIARGEYAELDIEAIVAECRARFAASKKQALSRKMARLTASQLQALVGLSQHRAGSEGPGRRRTSS